MKKILHILCVCLVTYFAQAQEQSQNQLFVGNAAVDYNNADNNLQMQMQIGTPMLSSLNTGGLQARVGFPYGVLYISPTFVIDGFEVSKGYFTDKVNIKWTLGNNQDKIEKINIFRKQLGSNNALQLIGSVGKDIFEYNDTQVEGGILYEYRVEAVGVSNLNELYVNYIEGVGFRNPSATVSGSVTFEGGSPVKDVVLFAEANGVENTTAGSSLKIDDGFISIDNIEYDIPAKETTLQSWVTGFGDVFKFNTSGGYNATLKVGKFGENSIVFEIYIFNFLIRKITLSNSYPTGELDGLGNDIFKNISELTDTSFFHITAVLENLITPKFYVNGREINQTYIDEATIEDSVVAPSFAFENGQYSYGFASADTQKISKIVLGDDYTGYIDEVRVWSRLLTNEEIRRDYRRYLSGAETALSMYLRLDENAGNNVYDLSRKGFRQNKNDGIFSQNTENAFSFSSTKPTRKQLGVFGVTDANGAYTIASIPYSGTGESFVITPSLGLHAFEPASQTVFLGSASSVVNQLNFTDISSFQFNGRAVYNVQDVFNTIDLETDELAYIDIEDFSYNKYRVTSNGSKITINKGEYYYEGGAINEGNGFYEGGELKRYPVIGLVDAFIYIDGDIVIGTNNQPVKTDADGKFTVTVPIGQHNVEVRKEGHAFAHNGFFPALDTFEFFEDQIDPTWFIDTTRISLVGKVVGGKIESDKPVGFGVEGAFSYTNNAGTENEEKQVISSKNNIGVATIILKGDIETTTLDVVVATNAVTGEYKASLIPYIYNIKKADLKIPSNEDLNNVILTSVETLNLLAAPVLDSVSYTTKDGTELFSEAFHHKKSFRYNSAVTLKLLEQEYETAFKIGDNTYDISGLAVPIYIQKKKYDITFEVSQEYVNKDEAQEVLTKEFFTEGTFNITNNLEIENKSTTVLSRNRAYYTYSFYAGEPNIAFDDDFKSSITVQYSITGSNALAISNDSDFKKDGIIKGGKSTGGVAFATIAPEVPDIILRDPPGSNSFASIEKGTTITYTKESVNGSTDEDGVGFYASIGPDITISTGGFVLFTDVETSIVADAEGLLSKSITNTSQNLTTNSYTFNQTISTSDDIDFVGSDGDLYIGNAKNMYYGLFDNMFITEVPLKLTNGTTVPNIEVTVKDEDDKDKTLYVSTRKDRFIGEQPTKTFFSYSQKYIVETLIPELIAFADNFNPANEPAGSLRTERTYRNQANLWKRIIQDNEKTKFDAKNNRETYKQSVIAKVRDFGEYQSQITSLVNENFFSNQSFDAGVGEFTSSVSTTVIAGQSTEVEIETSTEFKEQLGGFVNNVGYNSVFTQIDSDFDTKVFSSEEDVTTTISYTLKDNDQYNVLSVDVINMFDGNGPVFITKAGATSCPHEGETTSLFYKQAGYRSNIIGLGGEVLGDATNEVYKPDVKSDKTILTNIPESEGALFILKLKNNSETRSDLEYIIEVDALTLNGATTNVSSSGVNVYIPFNETIDFPFEVYKSSASSTFKYDNIRVYLKSPCDDINDSDGFIDVSVEFKKSCSKVTVSVPENNFIFNRAEGYSKDVDGNTTTNTLPITFTDFNTDFAGFRKIELQYRNASSANWVKFNTYYGSQTLLDEASDTEGLVIDPSNSEYTFNWDIIGDQIADGNYEFRAISYCTDNVTNISPVVSGSINLNAPVLFGTPQPSDGILDVGEDISIRFNEAIQERIATSIKVSGLSNQQDIDHSVSVFLDGGANQIELPNQILPKGSLTMQFWYKNATTASGKLISQENGINATLIGNELTFSLGGESVKAVINPAQYNFYSLVYQSGNDAKLAILENGTELAFEVLTDNLDLNSNNSIFIGGNNVSGNIHDVRFWSKTFTRAQATVAKDKTLTGRELNLLGYWSLDEGNGNVGVDKAKSRNAIVNLDWDIKPKGTAYSFANNSFLSLENVGFVQPSTAEDITLSFWIKTANGSAATIVSNGKGNNDDLVQTNGLRNKWSVNMKSDGNLELLSENIPYNLTTQSLADGTWHHIALVVKRGGSINAYVDALETTSVSSVNIGGISGNKILIGARLFEDVSSNETIDNHFTGSLDEIRLWNTARSFDQIKRDRYFEIDANSAGLMLYADFNKEDGNTVNGPNYNHVVANNLVSSTFSKLKGTTTQRYTQDSPALKPKLQFTNIPFSTVINGDQMIVQPELTTEEWSLFEGQILNFSVSRLYDKHFNEQLSPISWSAFVNKQEIEWFTAARTKEIIKEKNVDEAYTFTMDIVNKGGSTQPYTISGLPTWIEVANTSGTISPNSTKQVLFTVDKELAMGTYNANIFLETTSEFNDRLTLELRVLTAAPDWSVNAPDYSNSMNIIGKIKINDVFSRDQYTKVGAFVDDNPRGEGYLQYHKAFDSYFLYLTAYSNVTSGEDVTFKIWDALNGKVIIASINGATEVSFLQNEVIGSKSSPAIFSGDQFSEQSTALNKGWTWTSFFVQDARFNNIKATFEGMLLQNDDQIKSQNTFTRFENNNWFGSLTTIENTKMYKVKLADANLLRLKGNDVNETNINLTLNQGWNWLPFPIHRNISLAEALTFYNPSDGDVIKDQYNFAIYDASSGWSGTLNYMQSNRGYMMKSGEAQTLNYPNFQRAAKSAIVQGQEHTENTIALFANYNANMSIVAEIVSDEIYESVLVYNSEGILRGQSPIVSVGDKKMSFIAAFSNTNEILKFYLSNGKKELDANLNFLFENNKVFGNMKAPVVINLKSLSTDHLFLNKVVLYPNPFSESITINASQQVDKVTKIQLFNTIGALINTVSTSKDITTIDTSNLANGVYLIKLSASNGKFTIKKLVKK
ncbi:LamG-like jellyroll fold domain-containing protein [Polaribacter sp. IC063]|uniref:LamG-like jellyroll fold domain-containing protein n=1 Tax=Polaribacter sp. IC063 TaxID=57031 RepID=UPI0011BDA8E0|nr:LamG-like jellyroll fold domain-containing protein [Polaribacter sp. IC063]TXD51038.1 T9SS type A sorting domain-containing protein [Polaribacter sp. IC063]